MRGATGRVQSIAVLLLLPLLLAGCTYEDREPGLFGRTPDSVPSPSVTASFPPDSTAAIPVLGEATWTTVGPDPVPLRFALHGLRRIPGGTVLDWSVTALSSPGRVPGDLIDGGVDLPLDEELDLALVDAAAGRVYRPLIVRDVSRRCLCTPVALARPDLVLDEPRLLQVAFPPLPPSIRLIDVWTGLAPVFTRVPVAAEGQVSLALGETDLARPAPEAEPRGRSPQFRVPSGQEFVVEVETILASGTLTSVVWTLEARTRGPGAASVSPVLTRDQTTLELWPDGDGASLGGRGCLCRNPALWRSELTEPGRRVTVVATFSEVPRGTTSVDVKFGTATEPLAVLRSVSVTAASDGAFRSAGTTEAPRRTWSYRVNQPRPGWPLDAWPTPVPVIDPERVVATVDRIAG